jgi:hypothetical protein
MLPRVRAGVLQVTRAILLALLLLAGCGSDPGGEQPKPAVYSEAWYALPRCTIQPATVCAPGLAELQCDRALTTLEQDCANLLTGTALCSAQVDALPAGDCEPVGDGATWCCKYR